MRAPTLACAYVRHKLRRLSRTIVMAKKGTARHCKKLPTPSICCNLQASHKVRWTLFSCQPGFALQRQVLNTRPRAKRLNIVQQARLHFFVCQLLRTPITAVANAPLPAPPHCALAPIHPSARSHLFCPPPQTTAQPRIRAPVHPCPARRRASV